MIKNRYLFFFCLGVCTIFMQSCGIYRFTETALPGHIKTVQIPLLFNESEQSGVAEELTTELDTRFRTLGGVKVVARNADARIRGTVQYYKNQPSSYTPQGTLDVTIKAYTVTLRVEIDFYDQKKDKSIYKGVIETEGIYNNDTENEEIGRKKAVTNLVNRFFENALQNW